MTLAVAATAFMATTANAQTTEKFTDKLAISLNGAPQEPVKGTTVELEHQADGHLHSCSRTSLSECLR